MRIGMQGGEKGRSFSDDCTSVVASVGVTLLSQRGGFGICLWKIEQQETSWELCP